MPVHRVTENGRTVGWQWGESGKVYRSRAKAQAQARAIFARGYHEDATVRQGRREVANALRANRVAELQYSKAVVGILRGVHRGIMGMLERDALPPAVTRHDARQVGQNPLKRQPVCESVDLFAKVSTVHKDAQDERPKDRALAILTPRLAAKVAKHVRARAAPAYDAMAHAVNKKNVRAMTLIGIPLKDAAANVHGKVAEMRENNIRLIEETGRDFVDKCRDVFEESDGLRVEEIVKLLQKATGAIESRARLIGVDQTNKLTGALTQARQQAAGVTHFRWSGSLDERERPMHLALEGQVFAWDDPPVTNDDGDTNIPGGDYRCRCVGIPLLEGEDEEADEGALDVAAE